MTAVTQSWKKYDWWGLAGWSVLVSCFVLPLVVLGLYWSQDDHGTFWILAAFVGLYLLAYLACTVYDAYKDSGRIDYYDEGMGQLLISIVSWLLGWIALPAWWFFVGTWSAFETVCMSSLLICLPVVCYVLFGPPYFILLKRNKSKLHPSESDCS